LSFLKKALFLRPNSAKIYNNIGLVYTGMNEYSKAVGSFMRAIEVNPDYAKPYFNLGNVYRKVGDLEKAIFFYKKAIEIDPQYAAAHNNLAVVYYAIGKHTLAVKHSDIALNLGYRVHPEFLEKLNSLQE